MARVQSALGVFLAQKDISAPRRLHLFLFCSWAEDLPAGFCVVVCVHVV